MGIKKKPTRTPPPISQWGRGAGCPALRLGTQLLLELNGEDPTRCPLRMVGHRDIGTSGHWDIGTETLELQEDDQPVSDLHLLTGTGAETPGEGEMAGGWVDG